MKQQVLHNVLNYNRCSNTFDCYLTLTRDLANDGQDKKTQKLAEYEINGDAKVLQNTTYTTSKIHIGYGTEDQAEYNRMKEDAQYKHVVFTDRSNVPDTKPLPGTMKFAQIHGLKERNLEGQWAVFSSILPCSCPPCRNNITGAGNMCLYKSNRQIISHLIIPIQYRIDDDNTYGMRSLTVAQIKTELSARGMSTNELKPVLLARIVQAITREKNKSEYNDEGEVAVDIIDDDTEYESFTIVADDGEQQLVLPMSPSQMAAPLTVNGGATSPLYKLTPGATVANSGTADSAVVNSGATSFYINLLRVPPSQMVAPLTPLSLMVTLPVIYTLLLPVPPSYMVVPLTPPSLMVALPFF